MISVQDGVVRLDDHGVAALLGGEDPDPDAVGELQRAGLGPALETLRQPLVTVDVLVAGTSTQLHRAGVDAERAVVLLAVRPGLHQLMVLPPSHLAAALVRMTRTGPRRASAISSTWRAAWVSCARTPRACSVNAVPNSVGVIPRGPRSQSRTPRIASAISRVSSALRPATGSSSSSTLGSRHSARASSMRFCTP